MTTNIMGDNVDPITQKEFASFVFGYLNCVSQMIGQTIGDVNKTTPNPEAVKYVQEIAATYMAKVSMGISKEMGLPKNVFNKYMTKEIRDACNIIAHQASINLEDLDDKLAQFKDRKESYQRERNEWEDRHGN